MSDDQGHTGEPPVLGGEPPDRVDRLYAVLAVPDYRHALAHLRGTTGPVPLECLAASVAAGDGTTDDEEAVAVRLHHAGLPKLADAGVVEYDPRTTTVRYSGHPALEDGTVAVTAPDEIG